MDTGSVTGQGRPWEQVRGDLLEQAWALESDATAARAAGDSPGYGRLAGARDARHHVADALLELRDVAAVLDALPALEQLAADQVTYLQERRVRLRVRWGADAACVAVATELLEYWRTLGDVYRDLYRLLESRDEGGQAGGRNLVSGGLAD